jgi:hypothetical protein
MTDLNTKRISLSNELAELEIQLRSLSASFIDAISMAQYNVYHSFHLKLGYLSPSQVSRITKSKTLKTTAFKARVLQERAEKINAELNTVLDSMYKAYIVAA